MSEKHNSIEYNPEISGEDTKPSERLDDYIDGVRSLTEEHAHPDSRDTIEALVENPPEHLPAPQKALLTKIRELPRAMRQSVLAVTVASEILGSGLAYANHESKTKRAATSKKESEYKSQNSRITLGDRTIKVENDTFFFVRNNIRWPESLSEFGEMFLEPMSLGMKFRVDKDLYPSRILTGGTNQDPFMFSLEVPYEYARDFEKASPVDQEKMKQDMAERTTSLFENILPVIYGISFHKDEIKNEMLRKSNARVDSVFIDGFASGESDRGIDTNDVRNQKLSELRAENAATVLEKLFEERGVNAGKIKYRGQGELHLSGKERQELLENAFELRIDPDGTPRDKKIFDLIEAYNKGNITRKDALADLDKIVGSKRKVAIRAESNGKDMMFVVPIPLALGLLLLLPKQGNAGRVYAHFIPQAETERDPTEAEREQGRYRGRSIRRNYHYNTLTQEYEGAYDPVNRIVDTIKGYSAPNEPSEEIRDEVVRGARHFRKRNPRERAELGFDPAMPENMRTRALAYMINHYGHMSARILRPNGHRDFDLVNIYNDPQSMERLLNEIVIPNGDRAEQIQINAVRDVYFEMSGERLRAIPPIPGIINPDTRPPHERNSRIIYVYIGNRQYRINIPRLQALAHEYTAELERN